MNGWALEPLVPEFVRQFEAYVPSRPDPELMTLYGVPRLFRLNNNKVLPLSIRQMYCLDKADNTER